MLRVLGTASAILWVYGLRFAVCEVENLMDITYNPVEKVWNAPEEERPAYVPARYQDLLGNLLAGQQEFPWIIDIHVPFLGEYDAVGNLLTPMHVLTTCRTIILYEKSSKEGRGHYQGPGSIIIAFASIYLKEVDRSELLFHHPSSDNRLSGERTVAWIQKHSNCNKGKRLQSDFAVLGLARPIEPRPPYLAFAPLWRSARIGSIPDLNTWVELTTTEICYVAAWGKNYSNVLNPLTLHHKVKIRVYAYPDLLKCISLWYSLCRDAEYDKDMCKQNQPPSRIVPGLICMDTRAGVGAVCDQNKGAPVVCDGQVFGLVTRAVHQDICVTTDPKPFIVENLYRFEREGSPPLFSGAMVAKNRQGAAAAHESDGVILYRRG